MEVFGAIQPLSQQQHDALDMRLQEKVQALTAKRDKAVARRRYEEARQYVNEIKAETEKLREFRVKRELERQRRELDQLRRAKALQLQDHIQKAKHTTHAIEEAWTEKLDQLCQRHERDRELIELNTLKEESRKEQIFSSALRDLIQAEQRLGVSGEYEECAVIARRVKQLQQAEQAERERRSRERLNRVLQRNKERQEAETKFFKTQMRNTVAIARRRAQEGVNKTVQSFENFERDMVHAHKMELDPRRLHVGQYTRPEWLRLSSPPGPQQATMRGTQLLQRLTGGSVTYVPSLVDRYGSLLDTIDGPTSLDDPRNMPPFSKDPPRSDVTDS